MAVTLYGCTGTGDMLNTWLQLAQKTAHYGLFILTTKRGLSLKSAGGFERIRIENNSATNSNDIELKIHCIQSQLIIRYVLKPVIFVQ